MKLEAGTLVDGRFEILSTIGSGGFSTVCLARQVQLDRIVALKILRPELLLESDSLPRFEREAKAISVLKHKNIVSVYAYGVWKQAPYMVLEHVPGQSLQSLLYNNRPIEPARALALMQQICEGLACAHAHGIIHRDLKPSNVLLMREPSGEETVKLIDFGLAKILPGQGFDAQKLTEAGFAVGTAQYMSPEQCRGTDLSPATDVYAAACILFHCLTGRLPFDADTPVAVMYQHIHNPVPKITDVLPDTVAWREYQNFFETAMDKDPQKRYQGGAQLSEALHRLPAVSPVPARQSSGPPVAKFLTKFSARPLEFPLFPVAAMAILSIFTQVYIHKPLQERSAPYYKEAAELADIKGNRTSARATKLFTKALELNQQDHMLNTWQVYDALAYMVPQELQRGNMKEAERLCRAALAIAGPTGTPRHEKFQVEDELFQCLRNTGRNQEALAFCRQLREEHKNSKFQFALRVINGHIAHEAIIMHDFDLAKKTLAEESGGTNYGQVRGETLCIAGDEYMTLLRFKDAALCYNDAERFEKHPDLLLRRARLALVFQQPAPAQHSINAWLAQSNPVCAQTELLQATLFLQQHKISQAEPLILDACHRLRSDPQQRYELTFFDSARCLEQIDGKTHPDLAQAIRGMMESVLADTLGKSGESSPTSRPK